MKGDTDLHEIVGTAGLPVDDREYVLDDCTLLPEGLDGGDGGTCGGDDILDDEDPVTDLEGSLDELSGSVVLLLLPDHDVGDAGL